MTYEPSNSDVISVCEQHTTSVVFTVTYGERMESPNQPELREAEQILWELTNRDLGHAVICFYFISR